MTKDNIQIRRAEWQDVMESTKKFTEESKTEIKGATATSWEHKNGM